MIIDRERVRHIGSIDGDQITGLSGSVAVVTDDHHPFLVILIPHSENIAERIMHDLESKD